MFFSLQRKKMNKNLHPLILQFMVFLNPLLIKIFHIKYQKNAHLLAPLCPKVNFEIYNLHYLNQFYFLVLINFK
jgi:hypothetical protein